jgi:hypothetical protein
MYIDVYTRHRIFTALVLVGKTTWFSAEKSDISWYGKAALLYIHLEYHRPPVRSTSWYQIFHQTEFIGTNIT